jgi:hypothetical protein
MARLRPSRIAVAVVLFPGSDLQFPEVLAQGITYQCGSIPFRLACSLIGSTQELLIENNLDCFHMSILFHSILHIADSETGSVELCPG